MDLTKLIQIDDTKLLEVTNRPEIVMNKGQGVYLYDTEGNDCFKGKSCQQVDRVKWGRE